MAQQTAVEWLFQKLWDEPKDKFTWYALREKAIEIEKEQTEISDEEIREQGIKYDNQALSETPIEHFMEGAFWYREQLKK